MKARSSGMNHTIMVLLTLVSKNDALRNNSTIDHINLLKNGIALEEAPFLSYHVNDELLSSIEINMFPEIFQFEQDNNNMCFHSLSRKNLTEKSIVSMNNLIGEFFGAIKLNLFENNERRLFHNIILLRENEREIPFETLYWVTNTDKWNVVKTPNLLAEFSKELLDRKSETAMQIIDGCDRTKNPKSSFVLRLRFKEMIDEVIVQYKKSIFGFFRWTLQWNKSSDHVIWANQEDHPHMFIFKDNQFSDFVRFTISQKFKDFYNNSKEAQEDGVIIDITFWLNHNLNTESTSNDRIVPAPNPALSQNFNELCLQAGIQEVYGLTTDNMAEDLEVNKSRQKRDFSFDFAMSLTLVNYIFDGMEAYRTHLELNELKERINENELLDLKLAKLEDKSIEAINSNTHKLLTLQQQECQSEIELEEVRFNNYIDRMFQFFILQIEDLKVAISARLPDSIIQNYLITLCSKQNTYTVGCEHWFHRSQYELEKVSTTVKKLDSGIQQIGVKFSIKFILPILTQIDTVYSVLQVPIPLKSENDNFFYLHFSVPNFIGISEVSNRAYPLDSCQSVPFLKTRFCHVDMIMNSQDELDCASALLSNRIHEFCKENIFSSKLDCLYTSKANIKDVLVSHFNNFHRLDNTNKLPGVQRIKDHTPNKNVTIISKTNKEQIVLCEKSKFTVLPLSGNNQRSLTVTIPRLSEIKTKLNLKEVDSDSFWSYTKFENLGFLNKSLASDLINEYQSEIEHKLLKGQSIYNKYFFWLPKNTLLIIGIIITIIFIICLNYFLRKYKWIMDIIGSLWKLIRSMLKLAWEALKSIRDFGGWIFSKIRCRCKGNQESSPESHELDQDVDPGSSTYTYDSDNPPSYLSQKGIRLPAIEEAETEFLRTPNRRSFFRK